MRWIASIVFNRHLLFALLGQGSAGLALAGSGMIFVSYDTAGMPHYASQRYDPSYTLFLAEDAALPVYVAEPARSKRLTAARKQLDPIIEAKASRYAVDPALLRAIIHTESAFDTQVVSPKGAVGAMQLLPATAARYGATAITDPAVNIDIGTRHLSRLLRQFDGNLPLALAAYNSGEGAVKRHARRIPPYRETMLYVPAVLTRYNTYRAAELRASAIHESEYPRSGSTSNTNQGATQR